MPTGFLIFNDGTVRAVIVDNPIPSRHRLPKPKPYRQQTTGLKAALAAARGEDPEDWQYFYRVMGIDSIAYVESPQMAVAYLTKEQELRG